MDQRQRACRPTDGCSDNVFLLDLVLRYHHNKHKLLFITSMDIAKTFDSVTHRTINKTLSSMGLPGLMVKYSMNIYNRSTTRLYCNGWKSDPIRPTCRIKQGDPISSIIFNVIIDRLLKLPEDIEARIGNLVGNRRPLPTIWSFLHRLLWACSSFWIWSVDFLQIADSR